jgi:NNP family nitrate/nitrite transporter-like MFS transporter
MGLYLSGHVAWRLSHRATIAVSGMTLGSALLAIAFTPSLFGIRAELLLLGVGAGLYLPSGVAVLTENTHEGSWGRVLAIHEIGPNLGYICAPLIAESSFSASSRGRGPGFDGRPGHSPQWAFLLSGLGGRAPIGRAAPPSRFSPGIVPSGGWRASLRSRSAWGLAFTA